MCNPAEMQAVSAQGHCRVGRLIMLMPWYAHALHDQQCSIAEAPCSDGRVKWQAALCQRDACMPSQLQCRRIEHVVLEVGAQDVAHDVRCVIAFAMEGQVAEWVPAAFPLEDTSGWCEPASSLAWCT